MKFFIVTPSYNQKDYLKRCIRSVADQSGDGVYVHHHVQDGGSTDGTPEMLKDLLFSGDTYSLSYASEEDEGMYDAINRGWKRAPEDTDILAWLNCDEQYLEKSLTRVASVAQTDSAVALFFGSSLIVDENGALISYRKSYRPWWPYIVNAHLYNLSCAMFIKSEVFQDGFMFDTAYRDVGDSDFVVRCLKAGYKAMTVSDFLSAFMWTGDNMSCGENAKKEERRMRQANPLWVKIFSIPLNILRYMDKALSGAYVYAGDLRYSLYAPENPGERISFSYQKPSWRWPQTQPGDRD